MTTLRKRLFEASDRHDVPLTARRGLLAGLFQAALHLVAFAALFVLGLVLDVVRPEAAAVPSTLLFWGAILGAAAVGIVMVTLAMTDPGKRFWRVPIARLLTVLALYAGFWTMVILDFTIALFAGPAFIGGRVAAHGWLFLTRR